ncbi:MAG TPA: RHS repeat-associated core domain-containing protein, partial [Thermoanaerobaculia bacterium]
PTDAGSASRYFFYTPEMQLLASTVDDSNNVWGQSTHHIMSAPLLMNREIIWFNGQPIGEFGPPRTPDAVGPLSLHRTFDTNAPASTLFYTFTDHLGTPLLQTDATMAIVWRAEHEPYGNVYLMRKGSRTDQPLRFPGQELAMTWEGTEENYNVFRWYGAGWGRYTQSDPIGIQRNRFSNLFLYADSDPIRYTDDLGLTVWDCRVVMVLFGKAIGAVGFVHVNCSSQCTNGKQIDQLVMGGFAAGFAVGLPVGFEITDHVKVDDGLSSLDPDALAGNFNYHSIGASIGAGYTVETDMSFGSHKVKTSGWSKWGGVSAGIDIGISAFLHKQYASTPHCCK